jgi:hypothetical protein
LLKDLNPALPRRRVLRDELNPNKSACPRANLPTNQEENTNNLNNCS